MAAAAARVMCACVAERHRWCCSYHCVKSASWVPYPLAGWFLGQLALARLSHLFAPVDRMCPASRPQTARHNQFHSKPQITTYQDLLVISFKQPLKLNHPRVCQCVAEPTAVAHLSAPHRSSSHKLYFDSMAAAILLLLALLGPAQAFPTIFVARYADGCTEHPVADFGKVHEYSKTVDK